MSDIDPTVRAEPLPEDTDRWLADHAALCDLCRAGKPRRAVQRLRAHLRGAQDTVLGQLRG